MADPLSIAASVVGLLATTGKICAALSGFISGVVAAPQSAHDTLATAEEVRVALEMVKGLIDTISALPSRRKALVRLDLIAITFSNCVLTLSELESLVCFKDGMMHRLKWVWGENKVLRLLPRLESQKASLTLMVTTLVCQSDIEAMESREKLCAAVEQILQRDEEFAARVRELGDIHAMDDRSVRFYDNDSVIDNRRLSTVTTTTTAYGYLGTSVSTNSALSSTASESPSALQPFPPTSREFETVLEGSRVYSRAQSSDSDISFTSSAVRSHAWSHLSLNDISIIAVFRLPVTLDDINKFGPDLTFASLLQGQWAVPAGLDIPESKVDANNILPGAVPSTKPPPSRPATAATSSTAQKQPPGTPLLATMKGLPSFKSSVSGNKIKLMAVGDRAALKTSTLITYTTNKFPSDYVPTVFDNYAVTIMLGDLKYTLGLFDTSGQEESDRLRPLSYPGTDVFLVFVRIGSLRTFVNAEGIWIPEITHHCPRVPFLIVGVGSEDDEELLELARKNREPGNHEDYTKLGHELAHRFGVAYVECNILTQKGLKNVFDEAIMTALDPPRDRGGQRRQRRSWRPSFLGGVRENKNED